MLSHFICSVLMPQALLFLAISLLMLSSVPYCKMTPAAALLQLDKVHVRFDPQLRARHELTLAELSPSADPMYSSIGVLKGSDCLGQLSDLQSLAFVVLSLRCKLPWASAVASRDAQRTLELRGQLVGKSTLPCSYQQLLP